MWRINKTNEDIDFSRIIRMDCATGEYFQRRNKLPIYCWRLEQNVVEFSLDQFYVYSMLICLLSEVRYIFTNDGKCSRITFLFQIAINTESQESSWNQKLLRNNFFMPISVFNSFLVIFLA